MITVDRIPRHQAHTQGDKNEVTKSNTMLQQI